MGAVVEPGGEDAATTQPDVRSGDPATVFAVLFDAHAAGLHRYLSRRVGAVADDLVAETFLAGLAGRAGYDPVEAARGPGCTDCDQPAAPAFPAGPLGNRTWRQIGYTATLLIPGAAAGYLLISAPDWAQHLLRL